MEAPVDSTFFKRGTSSRAEGGLPARGTDNEPGARRAPSLDCTKTLCKEKHTRSARTQAWFQNEPHGGLMTTWRMY
jgi:hypothetical protein